MSKLIDFSKRLGKLILMVIFFGGCISSFLYMNYLIIEYTTSEILAVIFIIIGLPFTGGLSLLIFSGLSFIILIAFGNKKKIKKLFKSDNSLL